MTAVATNHGTARFIRLLLALALAATVLSLAAIPAEQAGASNDPSDHVFSDPKWYPLRFSELNGVKSDWVALDGPYSSLVACVKTNCKHKAREGLPDGPHGTWAIDFVGDTGNAIHAAGFGILHIGSNSDGCDELKGKWVWIDHGGGVVSRYHHLSSIRKALDGQQVTPDTKIAEMGEGCNNTEDYVHFEVRRGGVTGRRYNPGQLKACEFPGGANVWYPRDMPSGSYASWDDLLWRNRKSAVPQAVNCNPAMPETPERLATPGGGPGNERAIVRWGDPVVHPGSGGPNWVVIGHQTYHPSRNSWSATDFLRLQNQDLRRYVFTGLGNGRTYRYKVAYHNRVGHGNWSRWKTITVGAPPDAPTKRRISTGPRRINFGWYRPEHNGYPVSGYDVGIRRAAGGSWTDWTTTRQPVSAGSFKIWENLRTNSVYQLRVRARSGIGPSEWSPRYRAVTG